MVVLDGSSPRGRGKLTTPAGQDIGLRLIPARAGKTGSVGDRLGAVRAHPRAGGENLKVSLLPPATAGSSPRGRGKLRRSLQIECHRRLIPARAGKTGSPASRRHPSTAHPRAGGENTERVGQWPLQGGSSPRGRGKPCSVRAAFSILGLIPARAGKTNQCRTQNQ